MAFALGEFDGRRALVVEIADDDRGVLRPADGENLAVAARTAREQRLPLGCFVSSSGAAIDEGVAAVHGWGTAAREFVACSGLVPMVFCVTGPTVSGPALLLGLADVVVMVADAYAFVSGPRMVEHFTGEELTKQTSGSRCARAVRAATARFSPSAGLSTPRSSSAISTTKARRPSNSPRAKATEPPVRHLRPSTRLSDVVVTAPE